MTEILIKNATILDPSSKWNGKKADVLVQDGIIKTIGNALKTNQTTVDGSGGLLSIGWFDLRCLFGEPGLEQKETLDSGLRAASAGGFTGVALFPNTEPAIQTKNDIAFLKRASIDNVTEVFPVGAVTKDCKGEDFTEMNDLYAAGAAAFSDGYSAISHEDILMRTLMYLQKFEGLLIHKPENKRLNMFGQMHEGSVSTKLGMKGLPAMAEEITVLRDLELLRYTGGKLHLTGLSTKKSLALVKAAKKEGLAVTCDVSAYQTEFLDEDIEGFETHFKVSPPFREKADQKAILQAIKDGTIDALVSGHMPQDEESKNLEFDLAENGMINLQTVAANLVGLSKKVPLEELIEKVSRTPRQILGIKVPEIKEGEEANLTLLDPKQAWVLEEKTNFSSAKNTPYWKQECVGQVKATIRGLKNYIAKPI